MRNTRFSRPMALALLVVVLFGQLSPVARPASAESTAAAASAMTAAPPPGDGAPAGPAPWLPFDEAFTQRVTAPDGGQALLISAAPLRYRDAQGDWQPIDPSFRPVEGGFANDSNLLQIRARADQVVVAARYEADQLAWQPAALHLIRGDTATLLAEATGGTRAAASEGTVRYAGGWTLDGISDELVASPGQLEHNVIFQRRPPVEEPALNRAEGAADGDLALRALLRLPTGLRLYADGVLQERGFETAGEVELRDAAGRVRLTLAPARVYEQRRPEQAIVARYRFEPQDAIAWRVTMTTPVAWWLDADRTYPVVWDPAFAVVGNVQLTEIQGPGLPGFIRACLDYDSGQFAGVGTNGTCGERRLLVKFNGLSPALFPPDFIIERAQLVMAPSDGWQRYASNGAALPLDAVVDVYAATSGNTAWPGPAKGAQLCSSQRLLVRNVFGQTPVEFCDIQNGNLGPVRTWIDGGSNFGLLLQQSLPAVCGWAGCGFVVLPKRGSWKPVAPGGGLIYDPALSGAGVALVIHYRGPTLTPNQPFRFDSPPQPPAQGNANYARTEHAYTLPNTAGKWMAVAAKAMRKFVVTGNATILQGDFGYAQWSQYVGNDGAQAAAPAALTTNPFAYAFPINVRAPNCFGAACTIRSAGSGNTDSSNFILVKGSTAGKELRVEPVQVDRFLTHYLVEAAPSVDIVPPPDYEAAARTTGVKFSYNFQIDTGHIVSALNLPLLKDTRALVRLTWEIAGMTNPTASVQARLFPPTYTGGGYAKTHSLDRIIPGQPLNLNVTQGGDYGLVLELPGDKTPVDVLLRDPGWDNIGVPADRTITGRIDVVVCPLTDEPSPNGCAKGNTPNFSQGLTWIQVGGSRIYSPAGLVCNPAKFPAGQVYPTCANKQVTNDSTCSDEWCVRRYDAGPSCRSWRTGELMSPGRIKSVSAPPAIPRPRRFSVVVSGQTKPPHGSR